MTMPGSGLWHWNDDRFNQELRKQEISSPRRLQEVIHAVVDHSRGGCASAQRAKFDGCKVRLAARWPAGLRIREFVTAALLPSEDLPTGPGEFAAIGESSPIPATI